MFDYILCGPGVFPKIQLDLLGPHSPLFEPLSNCCQTFVINVAEHYLMFSNNMDFE